MEFIGGDFALSREEEGIFTIAFCTFLLQNQTPIFAGILKRTGSQIGDVTDAEIWVMDPKTEYFEQTKALKDTDLTRVRGVDGVQWAVKLFKGSPVARTLDGRFAVSFCLGLDDATLTGAARKMLLGSWERLREPDAVMIDHAGYNLLFPDEPLQLDRTIELNDHKANIVGISDASAPFVSWPVMHTRYSQAVNFVGRERAQLSYVLVRPQAGVATGELCRRIEAQTGLRARTSDQFRWDCIRYYLKNTGIPVNFGITIAIALIVGVVVAGQTFYLFTVENLKQFGAIKAIGVTNWRLIGMILLQAFAVGIIGFSHIRVDVDEHEAWRVRPETTATAAVRGNTNLKTPLTFVRFEPFVVPKKSLTGDSTERVDTRVLQVIYRVENDALPLFVGQQMDIFIEDLNTTTAMTMK